MKFTKLSLAALAAMAFAGSAFAVENVKVDGQIKLWYQTADVDGAGNPKMFDKGASIGDLAATLGVTGDLTKKVGFGLKMTALTTLGLENNLVSNVQAGTAAGNGGFDKNPYWLSEAYFTYKAGNTLAKIGRQALDTPFAYSENWGAAENTFESAVLINSDVPSTTLIGAFVGKSNGNGLNTVSADGSFGEFLNTKLNTNNGAYMLAAVNSAIPNTTLAGFYYGVNDVANAYWISAAYDAKVAKIEAIYAGIEAQGDVKRTLNSLGVTDVTTDAYAAKVSGALAGVSLGASYSNVSKGSLGIGNVATLRNNTAVVPAGTTTAVTTNTKLPTAGIGGSTTAGAAGWDDTTGYKIEAGYAVAGVNLGAYYNNIEVGKDSLQGALTGEIAKYTLSSYGLTAATKVDEINLLAAYISEDNGGVAKSAMRDQSIVRVVASINF
jgi:hypothetical protein